MPRLNSYLTLVALALSTLTSALPLNYQRLSARQTATVPDNVASGTNTAECAQFHTVAPSETCLIIENEFGITDALFHSLNPEVNSACTNLVEGLAYCVQMTSPPTPPTTTPPSNVANGTIIAGCTQFFTVPEGDSCPDVETMFNISNAFFHQLNPQVNTLCSNLFAGEAYCVASNATATNGTSSTGPPTNVAQGTPTEGCTQFFTVQPGDTCPTIESMFNITLQFFQALNPEVNNECSNIIAGEAYCVQTSNTNIVVTPANVATGTTTAAEGCTDFFTIQSGNTCQTIEQQFNITLTQFIDLNSEVNSECSNLLLGEAYCVQSSSA